MSNFMSNADALQVFGPYAEGIKKATPVEIDYEDWIELPQEERENGNYIVTNYPGGEPQSGGHIIENDSSELPQRDTLKFEGFSTYDDDTNEKTVVKNPMFVGTTAEWEALSAAEKAKYTFVNLMDDGETGGENKWKKWGNDVVGKTVVTLPEKYDELYFHIEAGSLYEFNKYFIKDVLKDTVIGDLSMGYYYSVSNYGMINLQISKTTAQLITVRAAGTDYDNTAVTQIYYR